MLLFSLQLNSSINLRHGRGLRAYVEFLQCFLYTDKKHTVRQRSTMPQYDIKYVASLIPAISRQDYGGVCRYYAKLPRLMQIEVHSLHTAIMRTRGHERLKDKQAEFIYATFVQAVAQLRRIERAAANSQLLKDASRVAEIRAARLDGRKLGKGSPTKTKIKKRYLQLILQMREKGKSWRDISYYLKTYHRQRLSYSYLRRVFLESQQAQD